MPEQLTPSVEDSIAGTVTDTSPADTDPEPLSEPPELAMQGFCPVTVINEDKWVEGKPEFGVIHLGKLYLFTTEEKMNNFLADPLPFTPVLNEIDVVRFFEERKIVPGKREWGLKDPIYNRMFFFADEAAMNHFYNEYERYTDAAIEVMNQAVKDANPGT
jgi:protein disulfide-isomerase